jgi:hypothetical protein
MEKSVKPIKWAIDVISLVPMHVNLFSIQKTEWTAQFATLTSNSYYRDNMDFFTTTIVSQIFQKDTLCGMEGVCVCPKSNYFKPDWVYREEQ